MSEIKEFEKTKEIDEALSQIDDEFIEESAREDNLPVYKLEIFEGPLELLLSLISKNKVNIYDIPIALILDQYLEYLHTMELFNLEIASEFIVMASQLMVIKSRMLLPKTEDNKEDPRQELVDMLLEYQRAKQTAVVLHEREFSYAGRFEKPPSKIEIENKSEYKLTHDLSILQEAYLRVYQRKIELMDAMENTRSIDTLIKNTKHVSVNERILNVMKTLVKKNKVAFSALFENAKSRSEIVATFLAVLELIKGRRIYVDGVSEDNSDCNITLVRDNEEFEKSLDVPSTEEN